MAKRRHRASPVDGLLVALPPYCWGAQLQGTDASGCASGHVVGRRHFKTKFCARCKPSMRVPKERVRALSASMATRLKNNHTGGMWSDAWKQGYGPFRFRVINNTNGCTWPLLIVFEDPPPDNVEWMDVPPELQADDGSVHVCVSKGTLVPVQHVKAPHRQGAPAEEEEEEVDEPAPVACDVVVPPVFAQFFEALDAPEPEPELEPESMPEPESPSCESDEQPVFASKEAKRMHRNRESAAKSRQAKKDYIATLERNVLELENTIDALRKENWYLQGLQAFNPDGKTIRVDWSVIDKIEC